MEINVISAQWQLLLPFVAISFLALRWKVLHYTLQSRLADGLSWFLNVGRPLVPASWIN